MRSATALTFAALVGLLLAVPARADYGCSAGYYRPTYYAPTYYSAQYPTAYVSNYATPCTTCQTPYVAPATAGGYDYHQDVVYRIAPDLAQARLAQEAAAATITQFKAELAKQQADAEAKAERQRNLDFQQQVLQLLGRQGAGPAAVDPQLAALVQQLQAENAQMRAALEKIVGGGGARPGPVPDPGPPPTVPALPPDPPRAAVPPAPGPAPAAGPNPNAAAVAQAKDLLGKSCMPCHAANNANKLTDLTRPELLTYEKCTDCIRRMITNNPKKVMPKDKPPGTAPLELVSAVENLAETAPHDPRLK